jgi:hypothetical protein
MAPRTLSEVGLVVFPSKVLSGRPPYIPETTLIAVIIADFLKNEKGQLRLKADHHPST